jgi:MobA/MobL family
MGYHLNASFVSRGKGQSVMAKAAYNSREKLTEERTGEIKDYSRSKDRPLWSGIFADQKAPLPLQDREKIWNAVDAFERRKDAQLALNFIGALPHQLTDQQREYIVKDFVREQFLRKGLLADVHIHAPDRKGDERNYHVHMLVSLRTVGPDGFGKKFLTWDNYNEHLHHWREKWAERGARELEKAGLKLEADRWREGHRTLEQQRQAALERGDLALAETLEGREATKHRGAAVDAMERRGIETERGNAYRDTVQRNDERAELRAEMKAYHTELDRTERHWWDGLTAAAIDKEKRERQFGPPAPERGGREKEQEPQIDFSRWTGSRQEQPEPRAGVEARILKAQKEAGLQEERGKEREAFRDALDNHGVAFARVTKEEAYKSHREHEFAKAVGRKAPEYREGEIVIVREQNLEYLRRGEWTAPRRVHQLDQAQAEKYLAHAALDKSQLPGIEAAKQKLDTKAQQRKHDMEASRLERATTINDRAPSRGANDNIRSVTNAAGKIGGRAISGAFSLAEKLIDGLFSILDPVITPQQRREAAERAHDEREAQGEKQIDFSRYMAERAAERQKLENEQEAERRQHRDLDYGRER